jgi:hypothetical protein
MRRWSSALWIKAPGARIGLAVSPQFQLSFAMFTRDFGFRRGL